MMEEDPKEGSIQMVEVQEGRCSARTEDVQPVTGILEKEEVQPVMGTLEKEEVHPATGIHVQEDVQPATGIREVHVGRVVREGRHIQMAGLHSQHVVQGGLEAPRKMRNLDCNHCLGASGFQGYLWRIQNMRSRRS
jgi:hypothetical protein